MQREEYMSNLLNNERQPGEEREYPGSALEKKRKRKAQIRLRVALILSLLILAAAAAGIALFLVIPLSIRVSDMIYVTYQSSIDSTIAAAEELTEETTAAAEAAEDQNLFQSIIRGITEGAGNLTERAANILNRFIESLAVMIVTSCVIPVLVLVFFLWLIRLFTGAGGPPQIPRLHPRRAERKDDGEN